jgi:2-enoate reductase
MVDHRMYVCRLSELADAVHDYGVKLVIQLTAGWGRVSHPWLLKTVEPVAPSRLPCFWDPQIETRELTIREIEDLIESFKFGAEVVSSAGIDAIELHAHEGYLFDQFQTAIWNRRNDKYGGSLENRLTFALEIIEAIKKGAGVDFPVI